MLVVCYGLWWVRYLISIILLLLMFLSSIASLTTSLIKKPSPSRVKQREKMSQVLLVLPVVKRKATKLEVGANVAVLAEWKDTDTFREKMLKATRNTTFARVELWRGYTIYRRHVHRRNDDSKYTKPATSAKLSWLLTRSCSRRSGTIIVPR